MNNVVLQYWKNRVLIFIIIQTVTVRRMTHAGSRLKKWR